MSSTPHLFKLPKNDFNASWEKALKTYYSHQNAIHGDILSREQMYQTKLRPMHPNLFYELSQVSGFNNLNGDRYEDYYNNYTKK